MPDTCHLDGYRVSLHTSDSDELVVLSATLAVGGQIVETIELLAGPKTSELSGFLSCLVPVAQAVCSYLNAFTAGHPHACSLEVALDPIAELLRGLNRLSLREFGQFEHFYTRNGNDHVFMVLGRDDAALRIVEDEFHEILNLEEVGLWLEQEAESGDDSEAMEEATPEEGPCPA